MHEARHFESGGSEEGHRQIDQAGQGVGFDAAKEEYVDDMMAAGIIDPTKVTRTALQNAASVASLLLTTDCMIAEKPKDKGAQMPMMPPGGMGGMDGMY